MTITKPHIKVLWLIISFVVTSHSLGAQTIDQEHSGYEHLSDDTPNESEYLLFDANINSLFTHRSIAYELLPVAYNFRGEEYRQVKIGGFNLADGITPDTHSYIANRLIRLYSGDSLSTMDNHLFGQNYHSLDPLAENIPIFKVGIRGAAGTYATGFTTRYVQCADSLSSNLYVQGSFGPNFYNQELSTLNSFLSLALRKGDWSVMALLAPSFRELRSCSVDEAFTLTDDPYYNPSCGVYNGELRNASSQREYIPTLLASHRWANDISQTTLSVGVRMGQVARSGLDYYDSAPPYPDHYTNLPSHLGQSAQSQQLQEEWLQGTPSVVGVDWQRLYSVNQDNVAKYVIASRVQQLYTGNIAANSTIRLGNNTSLDLETALRYDNSTMYKQIEELLGASYVLNIDYYNTDTDKGIFAYNNLHNPDQRVTEKERSDYNFRISRWHAQTMGTIEHKSSHWTLRSVARLACSSLSRRGLWQNSLREDSYGRSRWLIYPDCALHLSATRRQSNNARITFNGWIATLAPTYQEQFLAPENSNSTISSNAIPWHYGLSANAIWSSRFVTLAANIYLHRHLAGVTARSYYDDILHKYCNLEMSDINTISLGADIGIDYSINPSHKLSTAIAWYYDHYTSNPTVALYDDTDGALLAKELKTYLKGMRPARTPSLVALLGYKGWLPHNWLITTRAKYIGGRHITPNPLYRMRHTTMHCASHEQVFNITQQNRLGDALFLDFALGKQIYFDDSSLFVMLSTRTFVAGDNTYYAYEQMRLHRNNSSDTILYTQAPLKHINTYPFTAILSLTYTL